MSEYHFNLPNHCQGEHKVPAGAYKVTVTGLDGEEFVSIDGHNGTAWATLDPAINGSESGLIGASSITVPASGRVRFALSNTGKVVGAKVGLSKTDTITITQKSAEPASVAPASGTGTPADAPASGTGTPADAPAPADGTGTLGPEVVVDTSGTPNPQPPAP